MVLYIPRVANQSEYIRRLCYMLIEFSNQLIQILLIKLNGEDTNNHNIRHFLLGITLVSSNKPLKD